MTPAEIQSAAIRLANIRERRDGVYVEYMRQEEALLEQINMVSRPDVVNAARAILDANRGESKDYNSHEVTE